MKNIFILVMLFVLFILGCNPGNDNFILKKIEIPKNITLDTIEYFPKEDILLVLIKDYGHLGEFKTRICFINSGLNLIYEIDNNGLDFRISNTLIALVDSKERQNFGWFLIKEGKISKDLPRIKMITDSLEKRNAKEFVSEINGIFTIFKQGRKIRTLNYGNFLSGFENYDFENIEYGLYRINGKVFEKISTVGNALLSQNDGLYYLPIPGYGVVKMRDKLKFIEVIDSIIKKNRSPRRVEIP